MENLKTKITELLNAKYNGSYRFVKEKMFITQFGKDAFDEVINKTLFLDFSGYAFSVRVRTFVEGITEKPACKVCGKETIFNTNNGWQTSCSRTCHIKSEERLKKMHETNIAKYGAANYFASEEGKEKLKATNMEKYGVDNYAKSEEFKNKFKTSSFNR
jgi:hypothetical protein